MLRRRDRGNADRMDRQLEAKGVQELAILMSDSSGFSRKTFEYGIVQFLAVMTHCYDHLIPIVVKHRGLCLANNADNLVTIFPDADAAVAAAVEMHQWLARYNADRPDFEQFNICIGIHWGKVLRLRDNIFGSKVNVAAKIGEDLAAKDEILVTKEVAARLKGRFKAKFLRSAELGGRQIGLYRVKY